MLHFCKKHFSEILQRITGAFVLKSSTLCIWHLVLSGTSHHREGAVVSKQSLKKPPHEKTSEQLCLRNKLAPFPNRSLTKWPDWLPVLWCARRWGSQHQEQTVHQAERLEERHWLSGNNSSSNTQKWSTGVTKKKGTKRKGKTRICLVLSRRFWPKSVCWAVASLRRVNSSIIISSLNSLHNGRIWDYYTFGLSQIKLSHSGDESLPAWVHFAALGMKTLKTRVQSRGSWLNSI